MIIEHQQPLTDYADAVVKLEATPGFGASAGDEVKTMLPASSAAAARDYTNGRTFQQYKSFNNNALGYDRSCTAGSSHYHRPRGSFRIDQIYFSTDDGKTGTRVPQTADNEVYVKVTVTEPLFVPPFLIGSDCEGHHLGFHGINVIADFAPLC